MIRFTEDQKKRLKELNMTDYQISEIEKKVLIASRFHIRELPTLTDVRDEFDKLERVLKDTQNTLSKLLRADEDKSAKGEVHERIISADFEMKGDGELIEKTLFSLVPITVAVRMARKKLPTEQRRTNQASPFPVQLINEVINWNIESKLTIRPSSSSSSRFFKIVVICYEAINEKNQDPSRAVKAYISILKKQS